ncbi:MAG: hypothetical protein ACFFE2_14265 [Candidatus Thorarchaeota archaeon]
MSNDEEIMEIVGRNFLRKYWKMTTVMVALIIAAAVEALLVFLWWIADAQPGLIPESLGDWSVGTIVITILHLLFWEIVLVGLWVLVAVIVLYTRWYNNLPEEDKFPKRERGRREQGDAFGFLVGITWLIFIWVTGDWNRTFVDWTVNDWVFSWLWAIFWDLLIFGIPILLYFVYWVRKDS